MKLIKTTVSGNQGTSTTIDKDGITITQSGSDWAYIQSDTPFYRRDGKYAYEVTIVNEVPTSPFSINISCSIINGKNMKVIVYEPKGTENGYSFIYQNIHSPATVYNITYDTIQNGDTIAIGWDFKNSTIEFFINGDSKRKYSLKNTIGLDFQNKTDFPKLYPAIYFYPSYSTSAEAKVNFGQKPHKYTYDGYIDPYYEIIPDFSLKQY